MERRNERQKEQHRKLLEHYNKLKEHIFQPWSSVTIALQSHLKRYVKSHHTLYLDSRSSFNRIYEGPYNDWAMQHIRDKQGYPELAELFSGLEAHEEKHNEAVSEALEKISSEVEPMLNSFSNLKPFVSGVTSFYHANNVWESIHDYNSELGISNGTLYKNNSVIVATSDKTTLLKLKRKIEDLRGPLEGFRFQAGIDEDKTLLQTITGKVREIIFEIDNYERLNGKCRFEQSLKF